MQMYGNFMCLPVSSFIVYRNSNLKSKNISNKKQHDCETEQRLIYKNHHLPNRAVFSPCNGWCFCGTGWPIIHSAPPLGVRVAAAAKYLDGSGSPVGIPSSNLTMATENGPGKDVSPIENRGFNCHVSSLYIEGMFFVFWWLICNFSVPNFCVPNW